MSTSVAWASVPNSAATTLRIANPARDGTGIINTVISAAASGTRVDDIAIVATGNTSSSFIRLWLTDPNSNNILWKEIPVTSSTQLPSSTTAVWSYTLYDQALIMKNGWALKASANTANTTEQYNVLVTRAGDL